MESNSTPELIADSKKQIAEGVASVVYRAQIKAKDGGEPALIAIKSSSMKRRLCPEPHDILKEAAVLENISHVNIVGFITSKRDPFSGTFEIWTTWIPYNLEDILDDPAFTPAPYPTSILHLVRSEHDDRSPSRAELFITLSKSIIYQVAHALSFLHSRQPSPIAHRDIKPRNILLTRNGCVKLIDFGIAYSDEYCRSPNNIWPESPDEMYCDVATGPYRAPELIFGPRHYDATASDLWSFGATIAQFFTPIRLRRSSYGFDDDESDEEEDTTEHSSDAQRPSYLLPIDVDSITFRSAEWRRETLFESTRGSIGLAWSIFKLRGTPNEDIWPDFGDLPDARKIQFMETPCVELKPHLPNLPTNVEGTGASHAIPPDVSKRSTPLDLIHRLLVYPPCDRLLAMDVLKHPWFQDGEELLLPDELISEELGIVASNMWNGQLLGHWLSSIFGAKQ